MLNKMSTLVLSSLPLILVQPIMIDKTEDVIVRDRGLDVLVWGIDRGGLHGNVSRWETQCMGMPLWLPWMAVGWIPIFHRASQR